MSKTNSHSHKPKGEETEEGTENTESTAAASTEAAAEGIAEAPVAAALVGKPEDGGLTNPGQIEAYHKHEKMQWQNKEEAQLAELVTKFAFGDKKALAKELKGAKAKEIELVKSVAKKLEFDSLLTDEILAEYI